MVLEQGLVYVHLLLEWPSPITTTTTTTQKYGLDLGAGIESSFNSSGLLMRVGTGESTMTNIQVGVGGVIIGVDGVGDHVLDSTLNLEK